MCTRVSVSDKSTYNLAHARCVGEEPRVRFPRAREPRGKFWCSEASSLPPRVLSLRDSTLPRSLPPRVLSLRDSTLVVN